MRMGSWEVIGLCCLITETAEKVVRNEDIRNKILGNQNNEMGLNVVHRAPL